MRARGVTYDTGFVNGSTTTRKQFDVDVVRRELQILRGDLHCTAVRPTGGDQDRLEIAASIAAQLGLEVWYSPFPCDLPRDELTEFLLEAAERAEWIRRRAAAEVVFVAGAEHLFASLGFLPGASIVERIPFMAPLFEFEEVSSEASARLNDFFADVVPRIRERFGGRVSYASAWGERVDWNVFDIVAVDAYRSATTQARYEDRLRALGAFGKPVAITEFGSATYRGSWTKGACAEDIVVWDGAAPSHLSERVDRDEREQANAIADMFRVYEATGIDACFVHAFGFWHMVHHEDPERDLDRAGYGLVKPLTVGTGVRYNDLPWEPKEAFDVVSRLFGDQLSIRPSSLSLLGRGGVVD